MNRLWYGWDEIIRDMGVLCSDMVIEHFEPDVIVGLSRGGLTPGVMLSHWMRNLLNQLKLHLEIIPNGKITYPKNQTKK